MMSVVVMIFIFLSVFFSMWRIMVFIFILVWLWLCFFLGFFGLLWLCEMWMIELCLDCFLWVCVGFVFFGIIVFLFCLSNGCFFWVGLLRSVFLFLVLLLLLDLLLIGGLVVVMIFCWKLVGWMLILFIFKWLCCWVVWRCFLCLEWEFWWEWLLVENWMFLFGDLGIKVGGCLLMGDVRFW